MNIDTWWIRYDGARHDIYQKAQLAANNGNKPQRVCAIKDRNNPAHSHKDTVMFEGEWWVVEATLQPDSVAQNAGFARVERIV